MRTKKPWHHKEILEGLYLEEGLTLRQIAAIFKTSASNILYWMKKFNIKTRDFDIGSVTAGKKLTEEQKQHLSALAKERFKDPTKHPMYGHRHTELSRRRISETKRRKNQEEKNTCNSKDT